MPLYLTDSLGPKVNNATGAWLPVSDTYLQLQTGAISKNRLAVAQVSDIYLVTVFMQCTSGATLGTVTPRVDYYGAWDQGVGRQLFQSVPLAFGATNPDTSSSALLAIRAAASDIFISTTVGANGALPIYNLYVRLSRHP